MTKREAIQLFGNRQKNLAKALGITSGAISQWPDELPTKYADWVTGARARLDAEQQKTRKKTRSTNP